MSVESEIEKYSSNLEAAYEMVLEKGGDIPQDRNLENLADAIESIGG